MGRASKSSELLVVMNGEHVGNWAVTAGGAYEFSYAASWLASEAARPLSLSMPLRNKKYVGDIVYAYFDNLLPNNDTIRKRIQNRFTASSLAPFSLLSEIGRDCVGAIQLLPPQETGTSVHSITAEPVNTSDIEHLLNGLLRDTPIGRSASQSDEFRISLAGAQEKTAFLFHENQWKLPHGTTPTTHIFKLPLGHIGHYDIDMTTSIENEWLCGRILSAYGIPVAHSSIEVFGNTKALVVERFDRKLSSDRSWIIRLPQEDLCQATGTPPWKKYQTDGGPGIKEIMNLLLGSTQSEHDRRMFFKSQIAFVLLCAIDGHAKNFSIFLEAGGGFHLTPLYDVLSAFPVIGHGPKMLSRQKITMAMAVWGKNKTYLWNKMTSRHLVTTGLASGLSTSVCTELIDEMVQKTPRVIAETESIIPAGFPAHVASSILEGLSRSAKELM